MMIYVRKPGEQVFTPVHLVPPTVDGLLDGLCEKFQIEKEKFTGAFRQSLKG